MMHMQASAAIYEDAKGNLFVFDRHLTRVWSIEAHECPICNSMSYFWVKDRLDSMCAKCFQE